MTTSTEVYTITVPVTQTITLTMVTTGTAGPPDDNSVTTIKDCGVDVCVHVNIQVHVYSLHGDLYT